MYDEVDIRKILRRAVELQNQGRGEETGLVSGSHKKLSLEEIEEIAGELDLSPDYVRQAALEYEGIPNKEPLFLDTGNSHEVELLGYASGTLDQKTWAELRAIIEYHFDSPGKVRRRPLGIIWEARPRGILKFLHTRKSPGVEIKSSGDTSTIRIKQNLKTYSRILYPAYAALAGAAMFLAIAMVEGPEALFASAALLPVARLFYYWSDRKKNRSRQQLKDAMEQLQTIITRRFTATGKDGAAQKGKLTDPGAEEEVATHEENKAGSTRNSTQ